MLILFFLVFVPKTLFSINGNGEIVPLSVVAEKSPENYTRFYYDDDSVLKSYEQNVSLKTRDGFFEQYLRYEIKYDNSGRIKTIIKTQFSGLDTIGKKADVIKIKCSYKNNTVRLYNEKTKTTTSLTIDEQERVVKNTSSYNTSKSEILYLYDENNNIVKISNSYNNPDSNLFVGTTEYTFDKKKSVTANIHVPQWFKVVFLDIYGVENNILERNYRDTMDNHIEAKITYKYRQDGYPSIISFIESENLPPLEMKIEYMIPNIP